MDCLGGLAVEARVGGMVPAVIKWGKERFTGVYVRPGMLAEELKQEIVALTHVPIERQKIMCSGAW